MMTEKTGKIVYLFIFKLLKPLPLKCDRADGGNISKCIFIK